MAPVPNYFLSVRLDSRALQARFNEFYERASSVCGGSYARHLIDPRQIHLTLFVIHLHDASAVQRASSLLQSNEARAIIDEQLSKLQPPNRLQLTLRGIGTFSNGRVVYADLETSPPVGCGPRDAFIGIASNLRELFDQNGLLDSSVSSVSCGKEDVKSSANSKDTTADDSVVQIQSMMTSVSVSANSAATATTVTTASSTEVSKQRLTKTRSQKEPRKPSWMSQDLTPHATLMKVRARDNRCDHHGRRDKDRGGDGRDGRDGRSGRGGRSGKGGKGGSRVFDNEQRVPEEVWSDYIDYEWGSQSPKYIELNSMQGQKDPETGYYPTIAQTPLYPETDSSEVNE